MLGALDHGLNGLGLGLGLGPALGTIMTEVSTSTFKTRP